MKRYLIAILALLFSASLCLAQNTTKLCVSTTGSNCIPVDTSNPLPTSSVFSPTSTLNVNLTEILGAAPSVTNPIFVSPSTGALFGVTGPLTDVQIRATPLPVSGTVSSVQSGTWNVGLSAGSNAIGSVVIPSTVSATNSTIIPLGISAVFTGTSVDVTNYSAATVSVIASQASATDGLSIQQSSDGTNWDIADVYTVPLSTGKTFSVQISARFFRVVYTNGAVAQATFRLSTLLHATMQATSSTRPQDARTNDNDFQEVLAYGMLYNGTTWDRARGTITNGLATDITRLIPGTTATSLGKAEDAVAASGDTGVAALGVRRDVLTNNAAAGDYTNISTNQYDAILTSNYEKQARTYAASALITPAVTAQDIAIINGSASATIFITKVVISGIQTTGGNAQVFLGKRSTANTGGTSTATGIVSMDSTSSAASAIVLQYTANPTAGTSVGVVASAYVPFAAPAAATAGRTEFIFGTTGKPLTLRGVAEGIAVNLNGVTLTGGSLFVTFEWYEI